MTVAESARINPVSMMQQTEIPVEQANPIADKPRNDLSFLRKAFMVNSSAVVCLFLAVLQSAVLSRWLGPEGIGQYTVILSALMLAPTIACMGIPQAYLYFSHHDRSRRIEYLMNAIWAMVGLGLSAGAITAMILMAFPGYFGRLSGAILVVVILYLPVVLLSYIGKNDLLVEIEARRISILEVMANLGDLGIVVALYAIGWLTIETAVLAFMSMATIRWLFAWNWIRHRMDRSIRPGLETCRQLTRMGIRQNWIELMVMLNAQLSILLLNYAGGDFASVGYFSRGQRIALLVFLVCRSVMPMLFSKWASLSEEKLTGHIEKVLRFASTLVLVLTAGVLLTGKWLVILLYGRDFLPAVRPMLILLPGSIMYMLSYTLMQLLNSRGKPELSTRALVVNGIVNVLLSLALIPSMGMDGAAIASSISNIALLILLYWIVQKHYSIRLGHSWFLNREDWRKVRQQVL